MNYSDLEFDIICIDTQHIRNNFVACYLIKGDDEYALIDTGVSLSTPYILEVLREKQIALSHIKYIMPTHCHLDHAGGVSEILQHTPNAKIVAHPSCAKHLIDPTQLQAAVINVYGETFFNNNIGKLHPIDENNIILAKNQTLTLGKRELQLIETYGHAYHHYVIYDKLSKGIFAGDTLGVSYKELNNDTTLIFPPTTPTQFDPDNWLKTIDNVTNLDVNRAYLTHYNQIEWNLEVAGQLKTRIMDFCTIAKDCISAKNRVSVITEQLMNYLNNNFTTQQIKILKADLVLCAKGLDYWLEHRC
jgi:glyoxylase-like metal-dependent hydrolase (beta-lactamase superfamily II)